MIRARAFLLQRCARPALLSLILCGAAVPAAGADLRLAVEVETPAIDAAGAAQLADYLGRQIGAGVDARVSRSALEHWRALRASPDYELALDDAQFTAFRIERHRFRVIARVAGERVLQLVTVAGTLATGLHAVVGRRLATPPAPGLAGLLAHAMFTDPLRAPRFVAVADFAAAAAALTARRAEAAILPRGAPEGAGLGVFAETAPVPGAALSVSPRVPPALAARIARALLVAAASDRGRRMLARLGVPAFIAAGDGEYLGYQRLLAGEWGYTGTLSRPANP